MQSPSHKFALVTGSSRGLGAAIALELLERGFGVLGVARGEAASALLEHPAYSHRRLDLADLEAARAFFERDWERPEPEAWREFVLVNNAGLLGGSHSIEQTEASELSEAMTVNVTTPIWLMGFALRLGIERTTIANISSGAAHQAYPGWGVYCSSKAALEMAGRVLAEEQRELPSLAARALHVLSYAPHVVATDMQAEVRAADESQFPRRERFLALHREGQLVPARDPARHLVSLIEREDAPPYLETRYQP